VAGARGLVSSGADSGQGCARTPLPKWRERSTPRGLEEARGYGTVQVEVAVVAAAEPTVASPPFLFVPFDDCTAFVAAHCPSG